MWSGVEDFELTELLLHKVCLCLSRKICTISNPYLTLWTRRGEQFVVFSVSVLSEFRSSSGCGEAGLRFGEGFGMEGISRVGGLKEDRRSVSSGCRKGLGR